MDDIAGPDLARTGRLTENRVATGARALGPTPRQAQARQPPQAVDALVIDDFALTPQLGPGAPITVALTPPGDLL